jgi:hypothetical protein
MTPIKPGGKCHKHEKASMTNQSLQHIERPRKGQGKNKEMEPCHDRKKTRNHGECHPKALAPAND